MSLRYASPLFLVLGLILAGCGSPNEAPETSVEAPAVGEIPDEEPVSILRPDVEAETKIDDEKPAESFMATIGFPDGGAELDADALATLEQVIGSEQFASSAAIVLRTHSDSAGSDAVNERASQARGLAVAEWLIAAGAEPRRIDVIVFGEQNPAESNALPDGSPNEDGRAANRRVEVEILASAAGSEPSEPSDES
ncbi:MAG: OmpA family protein [Erythrobacter sp.]|uniref:OmpA family protein n=1 Tax=Erythrobacter sp. TaxID=1042 RepID=UPI003267E183